MALVAANLVPLVGVVLFGWSQALILVLYWLENGIVGLWSIPKIILASGPLRDVGPLVERVLGPRLPAGQRLRLPQVLIPSLVKVALVPFFCVHYCLFWLVHGLFVGLLAVASGPPRPRGGSLDVPPIADLAALGIDPQVLAWAAAALAVSHGVSFATNFVGRREYRLVSPLDQMKRPYGRVVLLHLTIILGSIVSLALGTTLGLLIVLVLLKTAVDLYFHLRDHELGRARREDAPPAESDMALVD